MVGSLGVGDIPGRRTTRSKILGVEEGELSVVVGSPEASTGQIVYALYPLPLQDFESRSDTI